MYTDDGDNDDCGETDYDRGGARFGHLVKIMSAASGRAASGGDSLFSVVGGNGTFVDDAAAVGGDSGGWW